MLIPRWPGARGPARRGVALTLALAATLAVTSGPVPAKTKVDATLIGKLVPVAAGFGMVANPDKTPGGLDLQRRGYGVVTHARLDTDLNGVLRELQKSWPAAPPPAHVYATPDAAFRAFSTPDGGIFISAGMLQSIETRDELAALVAHEYAHVLLGHHGTSKVSSLAQRVYGMGSLYLGYRYGGQADLSTAAIRHVLINELALESIQTGVMPSMTRKQESEADRLGADLVIRAGYNPVAIGSLLTRMGEWEASNAAKLAARQQKVVELDKVWKADKTGVSFDVTPLVNSAVSGVTSMASRVAGKLRRQHDPAEARLDAVREYLDGAYPDAARPDLRPLPWEGTRDIDALFAGLEHTHELTAAMGGDKAGEVRRLAALVRNSPSAKSSYARYVLAQAGGGGKREAETLAALRKEARAPDSLFALHLLLLDVLEQSDADQAIVALEQSRAVLGDPPELLPYSVRLYERKGEHAKAAMYSGKCMGVGHRALQEACGK